MKHIRISFILLIFLFVSCAGKTMILTDPYWKDFAVRSDHFFMVKTYWTFIKAGFWPYFETYQGPVQNFPGWFERILEDSDYSSFVMTSPFWVYENMVQEAGLDLVLVGGEDVNPNSESSQIISHNRDSFEDAGAFLRSLRINEQRIPIVVLWRGSAQFDMEYASLLRGWGDDSATLERNILILEEDTSDWEGKLTSFYNRFDFRRGEWSLFAAAEPALPEVLQTWPENETIKSILMAPRLAYLPGNIVYIIEKDYAGMMQAASQVLESDSDENIIPVESLFLVK